ncbi:hypothetical protein [Thermomonospora umbrina]|uniref:Uncharacterized protein n=1 Tax=Thermomonospora umbrina TaxID=111806 RepID=A0A3D9SSP7_9ACTN|nr:hypothetical protein [Thermomonospora umbrina]REE98999.1 hypothetical protein DFJ69_4498 [Thermomonospora umbrina]
MLVHPTGPFARRFPLVARTRPACVPLERRVADLCDRAARAESTDDLTEAAAVHNQAALIASDCGLPDLARRWCHQQADIYLRARPLNAQTTRLALEPIINLARLYIREGQGERAFEVMDTLFAAVSAQTSATIDGIDIPADLTDSPHTHGQIRSWLWAVLLATGGRGLTTAGHWTRALNRLEQYKGVGQRMLDGRQIAVIAHAVSGDTDRALTLLADTTPGQPWENAVTACLTIHCQEDPGSEDLDALLASYHDLEESEPGLTVFHTRLGLSFVDALHTIDTPAAHRHATHIATKVIDHATATQDGYAARDVLTHTRCRARLTDIRARELTDLVNACALDQSALPPPLLADLTTALAIAESITTSKTLGPTSPERDLR